jgi:regulator of sirC expression with transglutaminase-like and TPR domain
VSERADAISWRDCEDTKDLERAVQACTDLIGRNPRDFYAHLGRGIGFEKKGDYPRAIADFTLAVEINPGKAATYILRATPPTMITTELSRTSQGRSR